MLLPGLLTGEVSGAEAAASRAHLEECPACASDFVALERAACALQAWPEARVSDLESLRLAARLRGRLARRRRLEIGDFVFMAACVAFVLLAALGWSGSAKSLLPHLGSGWPYLVAVGAAVAGPLTAALAMLLLIHNRGNGGVPQ